MSMLSNYASKKESKGNALLIGKEAREAKALNPEVIDSTIGMLFDENGKFLTFKAVDKVSLELSAREKYSYGSTAGDPKYHEALYKWIFKDHLNEIKESMHLACIATPGGSGAICNTFSNYLDCEQKVLLPSLMWTNYIQMANEAHLGYETYELFDEAGGFNLRDFEYKVQLLKHEQGRVLIVINDPCQNPTGYSMSYLEWISVVDILNSVSRDGTPVILLYDMAYIDYDKRGFNASRKNIMLFKSFNENVMTILAFSGSKTLGLYGLRIGAQIGLSSSARAIEDFKQANDFSARGMWSGTSTLGQNIITKVLTDHSEEFATELEYARKLLIDRANLFIEESARVGLKHYPYDCGFFVTIPCKNPSEMFEILKKKNLYILPVGVGIRVTLSSITLEEVKRAVHIIKESLDECEI